MGAGAIGVDLAEAAVAVAVSEALAVAVPVAAVREAAGERWTRTETAAAFE